jgi:hypothetical protein
MSRIAWFAGGFLACLFLAMLVPSVQMIWTPYGKISYDGDAVEVISGLNKDILKIGREGACLPYGVYHMKLRNGKTLNIYKNKRGNVKEENGLVLINADENVLDVGIEE